MTNDERGIIVNLLVPNALYSGCWYDMSIIWKDKRPYPTEEAIQARYSLWYKVKVREKRIKDAYENYNNTINKGFLHNDGIRYYCTEKAINSILMYTSFTSTKTPRIISFQDIPHWIENTQLLLLFFAMRKYREEIHQVLCDELT